jgi:hypothetical protein
MLYVLSLEGKEQPNFAVEPYVVFSRQLVISGQGLRYFLFSRSLTFYLSYIEVEVQVTL